MNLIAQIFTIAMVLIFILFVIIKIKRSSIDYKYALLWMMLGFTILAFAIFPASFAFIADKIQIGAPLNLLFFLGILVCLVFIFGLASSYSKLKGKFYTLTQKSAILDKAVFDLTQQVAALQEKSLIAKE